MKPGTSHVAKLDRTIDVDSENPERVTCEELDNPPKEGSVQHKDGNTLPSDNVPEGVEEQRTVIHFLSSGLFCVLLPC